MVAAWLSKVANLKYINLQNDNIEGAASMRRSGQWKSTEGLALVVLTTQAEFGAWHSHSCWGRQQRLPSGVCSWGHGTPFCAAQRHGTVERIGRWQADIAVLSDVAGISTCLIASLLGAAG